LQFTSLFDANYTVSNVMVGSAADFFSWPGDFNADGVVNGRDFLAWQRGESSAPFSSSDLADWQAGYGSPSIAVTAVPEPSSIVLLLPIAFLLTRRYAALGAKS
jgi:hypothetical protein